MLAISVRYIIIYIQLYMNKYYYSILASIGTFDVVDTMITSPSSCFSIKESNINTTLSSLSLLSTDDTKMINSNSGSILDPSAPIFIPRQNQTKLDDDNETVNNLIK